MFILVISLVFSRIAQFVKEGTVAIGGDYDREQKYFSPTILTDLPANSKVSTSSYYTTLVHLFHVLIALYILPIIKVRSIIMIFGFLPLLLVQSLRVNTLEI